MFGTQFETVSLPVAAWSQRVVTEHLARGVVGGTARPYLPGVVLRHPKYRRAKANIMRMAEDLIERRAARPAAPVCLKAFREVLRMARV